jgi:hypothetical protein
MTGTLSTPSRPRSAKHQMRMAKKANARLKSNVPRDPKITHIYTLQAISKLTADIVKGGASSSPVHPV